MRNRQIRSALDGVVLILSAILFCLLSLVSCKSEVKPSSAPLPPPPLGRSGPPTSQVAPPEIDETTAAKAAEPVERGVVGGVIGGVVGGLAGGVIGTNGFAVPTVPAISLGKGDAADFNTIIAVSAAVHRPRRRHESTDAPRRRSRRCCAAGGCARGCVARRFARTRIADARYVRRGRIRMR
jgi:hypothetical protein